MLKTSYFTYFTTLLLITRGDCITQRIPLNGKREKKREKKRKKR